MDSNSPKNKEKSCFLTKNNNLGKLDFFCVNKGYLNKDRFIYIYHGRILGAANIDQNVGSAFHGRVSPVFIRFQKFQKF